MGHPTPDNPSGKSHGPRKPDHLRTPQEILEELRWAKRPEGTNGASDLPPPPGPKNSDPLGIIKNVPNYEEAGAPEGSEAEAAPEVEATPEIAKSEPAGPDAPDRGEEPQSKDDGAEGLLQQMATDSRSQGEHQARQMEELAGLISQLVQAVSSQQSGGGDGGAKGFEDRMLDERFAQLTQDAGNVSTKDWEQTLESPPPEEEIKPEDRREQERQQNADRREQERQEKRDAYLKRTNQEEQPEKDAEPPAKDPGPQPEPPADDASPEPQGPPRNLQPREMPEDMQAAMDAPAPAPETDTGRVEADKPASADGSGDMVQAIQKLQESMTEMVASQRAMTDALSSTIPQLLMEIKVTLEESSGGTAVVG